MRWISWIKKIALTLAITAAVLSAAVVYLVNQKTEPPVDSAWQVSGPATIPPGSVTVRFTGTTTLLFSDGETSWIVDGWFTRPPLMDMLSGRIGPDPDAVARGLAENKVSRLAAVIPAHSHYDHAMDAPEVALRTGAVLMGSESTANIGRGWNLPEAQIRVFANRVPVQIGDFTVTPIESRHYEFGNPYLRQRLTGAEQKIEQPLVPPAAVTDYRMGKAYVFHVSHPQGTFAVVGSAGYETGGLAGYEAEVVFLGIGGIGGQTAAYREAFWHETVETLNSASLHLLKDLFTGPAQSWLFLQAAGKPTPCHF